MLVLGRKKDESIIIDGHIVITVLDIEGDRVKIGITAPKEIPVLREELWIKIKSEGGNDVVANSDGPVRTHP